MLARPELDQASLDLLAAGDYILQHGWCRCKRVDDYGAVCIVGAISIVTTGSYYSNHLAYGTDRLSVSIRKVKNYLHGQNPWVFNDIRGRTKDEVIKALKEAAYT